MVPRSEHILDVAEPCLPSSRACWTRKTVSRESHGWEKGRKEEGRWTLRVTGSLWGLEEILRSWMILGKLLHRVSVSLSVHWA